jgi:RND family efflux transporter MFP subunit
MKQHKGNGFQKVKSLLKSHRKASIITISILAVLIIVLVVLNATVFKQEVTATTQTLTIQRGNVIQTLEIVGSVRAVPSASLSWATSGTVMPFTAQVGDTIKAGDVILELEPASVSSDILDAQTDLITAKSALELLKTADTAYQSASQTLANAESTYKAAKLDFNSINQYGNPLEAVETAIESYFGAREALWQAQSDYEAMLNLMTDDPVRVAAKSAQDEAQTIKDKAFTKVNNTMGIYFGNTQEDIYLTYKAAKAALDEARVTFNAARDKSDDIAAAEARVQALTNTINGSKIVAPFDGTITDIFASAGDHIANSDSAIQLDNLSTMVVDVTVSEVDINTVNLGDPASITFDAIPSKAYRGTVTQVGDSGTSSSGVVRFNVTITLTDIDELVKPGFSAVTTIVTDQVNDVLLIPTAAIRTINNEKMVIVMRDGMATPVAVVLGAASGAFTALISGDIQEGDLVVATIGTSTDMGRLIMMGGGGGNFQQGGDRQPPTDGGAQPPSDGN